MKTWEFKNWKFKYERHNKQVFKHLTILKIVNGFISVVEQKMRRVRLISMPYVARINTISSCNLKCIGCKGNERIHINQSSHIMNIDEYKIILDKLSNYLFFVILYDEGEPLLNPDIIEIINYTALKNIGSVVSTNFSMFLDDQFINNLAQSGLSKIIVALDGSSQGTYGKYRVGGDLDRVKENIIRFDKARKKLKKYPMIEIQFLDFGFNSCELEDVRSFSATVKAEYFSHIKANSDGIWKFKGTADTRKLLGCLYIWSCIDINNDGRVYPCDYGEDYGMNSIGNMLHDQLKDIWNNQQLCLIRKNFRDKNALLQNQCAYCPESESAPAFLR